MYNKYGWKIERTDYYKGTFLLGMNFNSNAEWGEDERETYICIYLGKFGLSIGKYHYTTDRP